MTSHHFILQSLTCHIHRFDMLTSQSFDPNHMTSQHMIRAMCIVKHFKSHVSDPIYLTSHISDPEHMTSQHRTSPYMTSQHLISKYLTSHIWTSQHRTSHMMTSHHMISQHFNIELFMYTVYRIPYTVFCIPNPNVLIYRYISLHFSFTLYQSYR
jgi:hypothetical protein